MRQLARLGDGRVIELEKDCGCLTHYGPHWLHMDRLTALSNGKRVERSPPALFIQAVIEDELRRLIAKRTHMERLGVVELLPLD